MKLTCFPVFINNSWVQIVARDKTCLDITWLKDKSLADLDNLPDPDTLAEEL
jgi:type I restriction enzyme M protein